MPSVRKLSADEVQRLKSRGSRVDLSTYEASLRDLRIGEWGVIQLEAGEKVATVKRRYTMAAKNQGKHLTYKRLRNNSIPFEVQALPSK
jgi:hypothetical protein